MKNELNQKQGQALCTLWTFHRQKRPDIEFILRHNDLIGIKQDNRTKEALFLIEYMYDVINKFQVSNLNSSKLFYQ